MALPFVPTYWPDVQEWCRKLSEAANFMLASDRLGATMDADRTFVDTGDANAVTALWQGTAAEYAALTPDAATLYVTTDGTPRVYMGSTVIV